MSKTTAGTATFSGANTYTGNTSITNGTLALTGAGTLGAITNAVTVNGRAPARSATPAVRPRSTPGRSP